MGCRMEICGISIRNGTNMECLTDKSAFESSIIIEVSKIYSGEYQSIYDSKICSGYQRDIRCNNDDICNIYGLNDDLCVHLKHCNKFV